jgi:membrane-bound serine protease (ClpP class)
VHFRKLGLAQQVIHTLTSPSIAYFLYVAGLALIIFEFFTAGVGLAGLAGAGAVVGAFVGFSHLPVHPWAVVLLSVGVVGFAVDVQAGGFGFWTLAGFASLVAGSLTLVGGEHLSPKWWVIVLVCAGTTLFMVAGMTAAVRSRFSTPTVGREGMVGEMGQAEVDVAPDGVVRIRDALWRARTNRATPIRAGDPVRVIEVQGLVLEVEPESGGARDYRH